MGTTASPAVGGEGLLVPGVSPSPPCWGGGRAPAPLQRGQLACSSLVPQPCPAARNQGGGGIGCNRPTGAASHTRARTWLWAARGSRLRTVLGSGSSPAD